MPSLSLCGVGHRYGTEAPWLFRHLTAELVSGEKIAVTGPSGSGKSSLLAFMSTARQPSEGQVCWHGIDRMQWVFQNPHGVPQRAAIDQVALPVLARGAGASEADARAEQLCELVGLSYLTDHRSFASLSGGEAQRLMLARALACDPDLLLIDEPTAQLDRQSAATMNEVFNSLQLAGALIVIATHDAATAAACDRTIDLSLAASEKP